MISNATKKFIVKNKVKKGIPLSEEQMIWQRELCVSLPAKERKKKVRKEYSPKDKAKYAIQQRGGDKWMQKWIDWDDESIPIGKRRVAYVRYLTMVHGIDLDTAKKRSIRFIKN